MRAILRGFAGAAVLAVLAGCGEARPIYRGYIPSAGYREAMQVSSELAEPAQAAVGEWVVLHASRQTGPWELAPMAAAAAAAPCQRIAPVLREWEVAGKVAWRAEPAEGVEFATPSGQDFERRVRFTRPGSYRLWAVAEGCSGRFESNRIGILVR